MQKSGGGVIRKPIQKMIKKVGQKMSRRRNSANPGGLKKLLFPGGGKLSPMHNPLLPKGSQQLEGLTSQHLGRGLKQAGENYGQKRKLATTQAEARKGAVVKKPPPMPFPFMNLRPQMLEEVFSDSIELNIARSRDLIMRGNPKDRFHNQKLAKIRAKLSNPSIPKRKIKQKFKGPRKKTDSKKLIKGNRKDVESMRRASANPNKNFESNEDLIELAGIARSVRVARRHSAKKGGIFVDNAPRADGSTTHLRGRKNKYRKGTALKGEFIHGGNFRIPSGQRGAQARYKVRSSIERAMKRK